MKNEELMLALFIVLGAIVTFSFLVIATTQEQTQTQTYAQSMEPTQEYYPKTIQFTLKVTNAVPDNMYRLCGGTVGGVPMNFGCGGTGTELTNNWNFTLPNSLNSQLYGCVVGDDEKKVSCSTAPLSQTDTTQNMVIDWSKKSATGIPDTFRIYESDLDDIIAEMEAEKEE
jgi:hypothetical protein